MDGTRKLFKIFLVVTISIIYLLCGCYCLKYLFKPFTGFIIGQPELSLVGAHLVYEPKTFYADLEKYGIFPGESKILAVGNVFLNSIRDLVVWDFSLQSTDPVPVLIERQGIKSVIYLRPVLNIDRFPWFMVLINCFLLCFTVYLIFKYNLIEKEPGYLFLVLSCLCHLVFICLKPFYLENLAENILVGVGRMTPWFLILFFIYFPYRRINKINFAGISLILILIIVLAVYKSFYFLLWMQTKKQLFLDHYQFLVKINVALDFISYTINFYLLISSYLRSAQPSLKRKIKWISTGFLISVVPYYFFEELPLVFSQKGAFSLGEISDFFLAFFPVFFLIGFNRARRMIFFVKNILLKFMLFIAVLFVYQLARPLIENYYLEKFGYFSHGYQTVLAGVILLVFFGLLNLINKRNRKEFVTRSETRSRAGYHALSHLFTSTKYIQKLIQLSSNGILKLLKKYRSYALNLIRQLHSIVELNLNKDLNMTLVSYQQKLSNINRVINRDFKALRYLKKDTSGLYFTWELDYLTKLVVDLSRQTFPHADIKTILSCSHKIQVNKMEFISALIGFIEIFQRRNKHARIKLKTIYRNGLCLVQLKTVLASSDIILTRSMGAIVRQNIFSINCLKIAKNMGWINLRKKSAEFRLTVCFPSF